MFFTESFIFLVKGLPTEVVQCPFLGFFRIKVLSLKPNPKKGVGLEAPSNLDNPVILSKPLQQKNCSEDHTHLLPAVTSPKSLPEFPFINYYSHWA